MEVEEGVVCMVGGGRGGTLFIVSKCEFTG